VCVRACVCVCVCVCLSVFVGTNEYLSSMQANNLISASELNPGTPRKLSSFACDGARSQQIVQFVSKVCVVVGCQC